MSSTWHLSWDQSGPNAIKTADLLQSMLSNNQARPNTPLSTHLAPIKRSINEHQYSGQGYIYNHIAGLVNPKPIPNPTPTVQHQTPITKAATTESITLAGTWTLKLWFRDCLQSPYLLCFFLLWGWSNSCGWQAFQQMCHNFELALTINIVHLQGMAWPPTHVPR